MSEKDPAEEAAIQDTQKYWSSNSNPEGRKNAFLRGVYWCRTTELREAERKARKEGWEAAHAIINIPGKDRMVQVGWKSLEDYEREREK